MERLKKISTACSMVAEKPRKFKEAASETFGSSVWKILNKAREKYFPVASNSGGKQVLFLKLDSPSDDSSSLSIDNNAKKKNNNFKLTLSVTRNAASFFSKKTHP